MTPDQIVTQLFDLFAARGMRFYGESVTEEAHALQSAWLASGQGEAGSMIATYVSSIQTVSSLRRQRLARPAASQEGFPVALLIAFPLAAGE